MFDADLMKMELKKKGFLTFSLCGKICSYLDTVSVILIFEI